MRRHLILVMVGIVAGALVLAGLGTYLLAGRGVRANDVTDVVHQARQAAAEVPAIFAIKKKTSRANVLNVLKESAGVHFVDVAADGTIAKLLPDGVTTALDGTALRAGKVESGTVGIDVFAAVPIRSFHAPILGTGGLLVVVLIQRPPVVHLGISYLLLVSGATLVVAALVAGVVSQRIAGPLVHAVATTRRIAGGDLEARVPDEPGRYPELATLTSSINAMADGLAQARTHQRQFLLSISHDLRTPLTSILGYAEAIADGTATDTAGAAGVITAEGRRLGRLVTDLLDLARLESRQFSLQMGTVDAGEVVRATAEGLRPALSAAGVSLSVLVPLRGTLWAQADPDRLSQVVANLTENALKFADHQVQVWAGAQDGVVRIMVDDDGPGIAPAEQGHVFERLYQASDRVPARRAGTGSGLGLAIVSELTSAMGGTAGVRSPTGEAGGTRMEVQLRRVWAQPGAMTTAVP